MSGEAPSAKGNSAPAGEEAPGKPPPSGPGATGPGTGVDLRERLDQMGSILAKGLDLAEAGVSLGVTILNRVSLATQQKMREGLEAAAQSQSGAQSGSQPAPPGVAPDAPAEAAEADQYGLTNRLPLTPGGEVRISFSVNNDSVTEVRKVEFKVQGFASESRQAAIDASSFAVRPGQKTIAPADFDKFVLKGVVPETIPPDIYRGVVVVRSDKDLFIPVILVVTSP